MHPRIIWQLVLWWSNKHEYSEHLISRLFWFTSQIETTKSLYRMLSPQPGFPLPSLFMSLLSSRAFKVTLFTDRSKQVSIGPAPLSTLTWPWPRRTSIRLVWRKFCLRELIYNIRNKARLQKTQLTWSRRSMSSPAGCVSYPLTRFWPLQRHKILKNKLRVSDNIPRG